jgi:small-conductance mechanosensitive channel
LETDSVPQRLLLSIALALLLMVAPAAAQTTASKPAEPPKQGVASHSVTPDQARRALETLQDDAKRTQLIDTLRTIANTSAATAGRNEAPAQPAAAEKPAAPAGDEAKLPALSADSLGAQLLLTISEWVADVSREVSWAARRVTHFSALWHWMVRTATDPVYQSLLLDITWKFVLVFGCALAVEWLLWGALRRPLRALEARVPSVARAPARAVAVSDPPSSAEDIAAEPGLQRRRIDLTRVWQATLRLPFVFGGLILELLPVLAFVAIGTLILGTQIGDVTTTRLAILAILNAYALSRALICAVRALVGPLGLFSVNEETAAYVEIWARRIVAVGVAGVTFANVALLLGLHPVGYAALLRLVMLAVHLFVVVIILQSRHQVARFIRAPHDQRGVLSATRNRVARYWHYPAIAIVLALWLIWALNVRDGYVLLLQYVAGSIAVLVIARVLSIVVLSLIDRGFRINAEILQRFPGLEARANRYLPLLRKVASGVIVVIAAVALLQVWGVDAIVWFYGGQIGGRLVSAAATVGVAAFVAVAVWEASNALMDNRLTYLTNNGQAGRAARLRTFQPMLRTTLFCVIVTIVALTALSEVGVNVAPLLAGAGIIGIAIGFGSQKLVQDVITGLFLLLENVVQVGNYVTVSGLSGTVENLSIRTIRLRATDGAVHVVPFSAVTSLTNYSRGIGNADVRVNIAYHEDTDRVCELLKEIAIEMRKEPEYEAVMRSDLNLWGVDQVDGLMVTIVGKINCTDSGRWAVQREFNRRMKRRFQEEGIQIATSNQSLMVPLPRRGDADESEAASPAQRRAVG